MRTFVLLLTLSATLSTAAQKKLALIVAVGNYMPTSGIPTIASLNDIKYVKEVLHTNGFLEKNIDTLKDSKATKAAILKALDVLALKAKKGDIVLIHFSCHGQQIRDQQTPETGKDEDDGYDEALLPYDVKKPQYFPGVYTGENHLRDDDLGKKLIAIRNALGSKGSLLVLIDACHSGTATRAMEFTTSRGEPIPFYDPANPLDEKINLSDDHFFDQLSDSASNMVMISGSGPHQQNFQTEVTISGKKEQVGSLTWAFYKAMSDLPKESDYALLFQKIKAQIQSQHPEQIPLVEGNTSQQVFSGLYNPKKESVILTIVDSDSIFKIDRGVMDGVVEGAKLKIYKPGNSNMIAEGIIKRSDRFIAYGISNTPLSKGGVYEVKLDEISYGSISTVLKIRTGTKSPQVSTLETQVVSLFKPYRFVTLGDNADMMIDLSPTDNGININLVDAVDSTRWQKLITSGDSLHADDVKDLLTAIKNSMRVKYLRTMADGGELAQFITIQVIPGKPDDNKEDLTFETGDNYSLKITNSGNDKLFYTVLDITPDNKVEVLYPFKGREPANYLVDKNATITRDLRVSKNTPVGREFLKIIVSKEPMDLRSVLEHTSRRSEMRSFQSALDDLFNDDNNERATRGDIGTIKAEEVGIVTSSFMIKK